MEQLEFEFLKDTENYSLDNFILFSSNDEAFCFLNNNKNIVGLIFLIGEKKSGKTYLANIWKNNVNAKFIDYKSMLKLNNEEFNSFLINKIENYENYIIDDINLNKFDEMKFFHLLNIINLKKCNLLVTTTQNVNKHKFELKDLKSRINSSIKLKIGKLTEEIKYIFFLKLFSDKQIILKPKTAKYIFKYSPNNYEGIYNFVNKVINIAKNKKNKISIQFFKRNFSDKIINN